MTRVAGAIETLSDEVLHRSPLTTVYFYDDTPKIDSDHDPNDFGVVCACDIMAGHGLDLHALSREIVASRHPELAYVIYNRQIASRNTNWEWVAYYGSNPHTDHIHVSVGIGPDGHKKPPYDSTRKWLEEMGDIFCKKGDSGPAVQSLQIGLNLAWRMHTDYNGSDIVKMTSVYDTATCAAVYKLLSGPKDGANFNPTLYWRLLQKVGIPGPEGPPGKTAVIAVGTVLTVTE